ncbi:MAG: hypothetical protein M3Y35_13230 [Actinomycetota bacterium]|nr:hypothetical protein [Actinomycetota bacterium]
MTGSTGTAVTPVFPESEVVPPEPPAVLNFRGKTYKQGDSLVLTDGESPGQKLPSGCPGEAWMVNPDL